MALRRPNSPPVQDSIQPRPKGWIERWSLILVDDWSLPDDPLGSEGRKVRAAIEGQFMPSDMDETVSTSWSEIQIPGRRAPHLQWARGEQRKVTFGAMFFNEMGRNRSEPIRRFDDRDPASLSDVTTIYGGNPAGILNDASRRVRLARSGYDDNGKVASAAKLTRIENRPDVMAVRKFLLSALEPVESLGRPPKWHFVCGDLAFDCFVESVGGVQYGRFLTDGVPSYITFSLTLLVADEDYKVPETDPLKPDVRSLLKPMPTGGTYESLAADYYGDPMLGVLLRQEGDEAFPAAGAMVRMPKASIYRSTVPSPKSLALLYEDDVADAIEAAYDERATGYQPLSGLD